jgi:hypothetical protein
MQRIELPDRPARILTVAGDGSIRFISPVSGGILSTGFPVMKDIKVKSSLYDPTNGTPYPHVG